MRIAAYLSGHGFGHAMRGSIILQAIGERITDSHFFIKTRAPRWLFRDLSNRVRYSRTQIDVTPVQTDAFNLNIEKTVHELRKWIRHSERWIDTESRWLREMEIELMLTDISPWASAAAHAAGIPSVLTANFTWDWIYSNLPHGSFLFEPYIGTLRRQYAMSDWVFAPEPAAPMEFSPYPITAGMVGRRCRYSREEVRKRLTLPTDTPVVLLTFGGIGTRDFDYHTLNAMDRFIFMTTQPGHDLRNGIFLQPHTVEHACLVQAADIVVGKLGYGTVTECIIHGTPVLYTERQNWPEHRILRTAIHDHVPARCLSRERFFRCDWLDSLNDLMDMPRGEEQYAYGADQIAEILTRSMV